MYEFELEKLIKHVFQIFYRLIRYNRSLVFTVVQCKISTTTPESYSYFTLDNTINKYHTKGLNLSLSPITSPPILTDTDTDSMLQ